MTMQMIEGRLTPPTGRFVLVASRFNELVVDRLLQGAQAQLERLGVGTEHITVVRVPGANEVPLACKHAISGLKPVAVIALGAVVRGETFHFEVVAGGSASGLAQIALETGVPVLNAIVTTNTLEQALDRAGGKAGNKGADAALAAVEMVNLLQSLHA